MEQTRKMLMKATLYGLLPFRRLLGKTEFVKIENLPPTYIYDRAFKNLSCLYLFVAFRLPEMDPYIEIRKVTCYTPSASI